MLFLLILKTSLAQNFSAVLHLADRAEAEALLQTEDEFIAQLSPFDIQSRLGDRSGSKVELLSFIGSQARSFENEEIKKLNKAAATIDSLARQKAWHLNFPKRVYILKTTGAEEGGAAGYTRGNFIVLKEDFLKKELSVITRLLAHEAFHILSRANPNFRKELYALIGFKMMPPISYPPLIKDRRITNPDAIQTDAYLELEHKGQKRAFMMVLYADQDYRGGSFFKYLQIGFLALNDQKQVALDEEGEAQILGLKELQGSFFEQVGRNTDYILHPEEIMAENFVMALLGESGPDRQLLKEIDAVLKKLGNWDGTS